MAGGQLNFPPEIMEAVSTMQRAAKMLGDEMNTLKGQVSAFTNTSQSAAIGAVDEAHRIWQQSGLAHNEGLDQMARAAGDSYQDITSFDNSLANKFR